MPTRMRPNTSCSTCFQAEALCQSFTMSHSYSRLCRGIRSVSDASQKDSDVDMVNDATDARKPALSANTIQKPLGLNSHLVLTWQLSYERGSSRLAWVTVDSRGDAVVGTLVVLPLGVVVNAIVQRRRRGQGSWRQMLDCKSSCPRVA